MLKKLIKKNKLNQTFVANKMGVTQQLVSSWCTGRCEPSISQLKPLSEILKVDLETLVDCFTKAN